MSSLPRTGKVTLIDTLTERAPASKSALRTEAATRGLYRPQSEKDACGVGFIANMKGENSHRIVRDGLQILENLTHRGAVGADPLMGDGAGMLLQKPDAFFREEMATQGVTLPAEEDYAVGFLFLPQDEKLRAACEQVVEDVIAAEGQTLLGWRTVPVDNSCLSQAPDIQASEPVHRQVFIARGKGTPAGDDFERRLFILRKVISNTIYGGIASGEQFYIVSLSSRTIVYKGMFLAYQLGAYFSDLRDERFTSSLALVHQRFSTNTFPSWKLAHPYRMVAHNGEINTLRGNVNRMRAREALFQHPLLEDAVEDLRPVILDEDGSDTACFDNALELLVMCGYPLEQALAMMVPEA